MTTKNKLWIKSGVAAIVTGSASSGLSALGIATANGLGASVPQLDWKQLGVMMLSGGLVGMLTYLKQSPVPPSGGETEFIAKQDLPPVVPVAQPKDPTV